MLVSSEITQLASKPTAAIAIQNLNFKWNDSTVVLNDLSLGVPSGTIMGIVGASGSGKTTLMRLIAGIIRPHSGNIRVFDEFPSAKLWSRIGYMPQSQALYQDLTVQQNLDFFARMFGLSRSSDRRDAVDKITDQVSLQEKRNDTVDHLSGGERQRVSLAITLVHNPPLLLLDEPTVGLDPKLRAELWDHFRELTSDGTTLVISTHNMEDARRCDQVGFLHFGRMVAVGPPAELVKSTGDKLASLEDAFLHFINVAGRDL